MPCTVNHTMRRTEQSCTGGWDRLPQLTHGSHRDQLLPGSYFPGPCTSWRLTSGQVHCELGTLKLWHKSPTYCALPQHSLSSTTSVKMSISGQTFLQCIVAFDLLLLLTCGQKGKFSGTIATDSTYSSFIQAQAQHIQPDQTRVVLFVVFQLLYVWACPGFEAATLEVDNWKCPGDPQFRQQ